MSIIIKNVFINKKGQCFDKVKEVSLQREDINLNLGKLVAETDHESNNYFADSLITSGIYLYRSNVNPNIAYRIYKEFADFNFNGYNDDKMIQNLQEKQSKIKLTKFPMGVVTLNGNIIGQEIPYYSNYITLFDYFKNHARLDYFKIYTLILQIIKEMYDEQILYLDIHPRNFMINEKNFDIKIIDFDESYVKFENYNFYQEQLFLNIKNIIDRLNKTSNIDCGVFLQTDNFDDSFYQIKQMQKKFNFKYNI